MIAAGDLWTGYHLSPLISGSIFHSLLRQRIVIHKSHYINKIRSLGYTYKSRQKRTDLWRKRGGTHYISVPLNDSLEDEFVFSSLHQAGCSDDEIRAFIASAKS